MFKIFKKVKKQAAEIDILNKKLRNLQTEIDILNKTIKNINIYNAIGTPIESDRCAELLIEARKKGFFNKDSYFKPLDDGWSENAYFKHNYSSISCNYEYNKETDTLKIPAIGVEDNFSMCRVSIYKNGKWAKIL